MNLRLIVICLLAVFFQSLGLAADTNLTTDADVRSMLTDIGFSTRLVATSEWSKPVTGGQGTSISGRLLVFDGEYFTNESGRQVWGTAPVYFEIHNETGLLTEICFDWAKDIRLELRDMNGKPADDLRQRGGGSYVLRHTQWVSVPANGLLQLRANDNIATMSLSTNRQKTDGLFLFASPGKDWLIPADDTNAYFLSATFSSQPTNSSLGGHAIWQAKLEFPTVKLGSSVLK